VARYGLSWHRYLRETSVFTLILPFRVTTWASEYLQTRIGKNRWCSLRVPFLRGRATMRDRRVPLCPLPPEPSAVS
jgi:hypothetical protein